MTAPAPRPQPQDWLLVLAAARSVLASLDQRPGMGALAAAIELRHALNRCAASVGIPSHLLTAATYQADQVAEGSHQSPDATR